MNSTPDRRRMLERQQSDVALNQRAVAVLDAIEQYGGVLSTVQIAMLLWPPSLSHKLRHQGIAGADVKRLMQRYPADYLDERIELYKWLKQQRRTASTPVQLELYLHTYRSPSELIHADVELPQAFVERRQMSSNFVSSSCKRWLRKLFDGGYIEPQEQPVGSREGRKPLLWFLSKKGRRFLAEYRGVATKEVTWKAAGSFSPAMLPHRLQNTDLRISTEIAARHHGWSIYEWQDEQALRQRHAKPDERVSWQRPENPNDPDGELVEESGAMVPDHYFWLNTGKNWHHFYECDRATETIHYRNSGLRDFAYKIRAYGAYYKSGRYFITYPQAGRSFRVLVVTTSEQRLQNLKSCIEDVVRESASDAKDVERGFMRYWLTTFDCITPTWSSYFSESLLTGEIWLRAGQDRRRPWSGSQRAACIHGDRFD